MQLKGSDRQFMEVGSCSIVEKFFRIHLGHIKRFNDIYLLSLSAKSTFKIIHFGGFENRFFQNY